jgi:YfiH family protein
VPVSDRSAPERAELLRIERFPAPHAFTTRRGGVSRDPFASLNLGLSVGDAREAVEENRRRALRAFGADPERTARVSQVHGAAVVEAREARPDLEADALVSDDPGWTLAISMADCVPVLLVDPTRGAVAGAHAGWRGLAAGVLGATVATLRDRYGSPPGELWAAIGPHVSGPRYQVGPEVVDALRAAGLSGDHARPDPSEAGRFRLSLGGAAREALVRAGVPGGRVLDGGWCTASEPDRFYSHRRDGRRTGRHWALLRAPDPREARPA